MASFHVTLRRMRRDSRTLDHRTLAVERVREDRPRGR